MAMVIIDIVAVYARVLMAKSIFGLSVGVYMWQVVARVVLVTIVALPIPLLLRLYMDETIYRFVVVVVVSVISTAVAVLYVGCSSSERSTLLNKLKSILRIK